MGALTGAYPVPFEEQEEADSNAKWTLKKLQPWHKQMCSMLAQGIERMTIAGYLDCTPEYVSMLAKQPLIIEEVNKMSGYAALQLEAQFSKSVTAIGEALENGNHKEKIMAARLQMEATKRIGSKTKEEEKLIDTNARLAKLAERLIYLQGNAQQQIIQGEVIKNEQDQTGAEAEDGNWTERNGVDEGSNQST